MLIESKIKKYLNEEEMPFKNNKETRKYLMDLVKNDDFAKPFSFDIVNLETGEVYFNQGESILSKAKAHLKALIRDTEKSLNNDRKKLADAEDEDEKIYRHTGTVQNARSAYISYQSINITRSEKIIESLYQRRNQEKLISQEYVEDLFLKGRKL